jgi:hypothetical protein
MTEYYIYDTKLKQGPFTLAQLKEKNITKDSRIWHGGLRSWIYADEIPEISAQFGFASPARGRRRRKISVFNLIFHIAVSAISLFAASIIYGVLFDEFSESDLVVMSFFWLIPFCYGTGGFVATILRSRVPFLFGLLAAATVGLFLLLFFALAWSSL